VLRAKRELPPAADLYRTNRSRDGILIDGFDAAR
jgi:hypothetical protein